MWQTKVGNMMVQVIWFYHPAEVEGTSVGCGRVEDIKRVGSLLSSSHYDDNDVQTISHTHQGSSGELDMETESIDTYYLAGEYHPVEGIIKLEQEIWE